MFKIVLYVLLVCYSSLFGDPRLAELKTLNLQKDDTSRSPVIVQHYYTTIDENATWKARLVWLSKSVVSCVGSIYIFRTLILAVAEQAVEHGMRDGKKAKSAVDRFTQLPLTA